jgi:prolyl-tRNA synthetase
MGAIVEVYNDELGIIWPEEVAPFKVHLILVNLKDDKKMKKLELVSEKLYKKLLDKNIEVLFDDRKEVTTGEKLVESDLLGIPYRIVIGENFLKYKKVDFKERKEKKYKQINLQDVLKFIK